MLLKVLIITGMEAPRPHVTNRWKFNSGTYYVEAPEEKRLPGFVSKAIVQRNSCSKFWDCLAIIL